MLFKASAPGSLMLLGEYAVLHGKPALVGAVNKRITVSLTPRLDQVIRITSQTSEITSDLSLKIEDSRFRFVLAALRKYSSLLRQGFDLKVDSEFTDTLGLGSSAAVTVATLAVLAQWLTEGLEKTALMRAARQVVQAVQGVGSGADVAASVWGGVVSYQMNAASVERLPALFPLTVIYSGHKTPTVNAINTVRSHFVEKQKALQTILDEIGLIATQGIDFARRQNWAGLGQCMNAQQNQMEALGVSTPALREIIALLRRQPDISGAKISGSGLGDSAIGLGLINPVGPFQYLDVKLSEQGVQCEKV